MPQDVTVTVSDEAVAALVALHGKWRAEHADDKAFIAAVIKKRCEELCASASSALKQQELAALEAGLTLDERIAKLKA